MIIIATPNEATLIPECWDYPIEEIGYLLNDYSSANDGVFVLHNGRLFEAILNPSLANNTNRIDKLFD